jgi:1-acyl-sn-glycerol-3-phosphate acyltransferase
MTAIAGYGAWLIICIFLAPFKVAKFERRLKPRLRSAIFGGWAKLAARTMGLRIEVRGQPSKPPFFLVSNHLSYLDIVAYATQFDCVFVAKSEVASWPGIGRVAREVGTIFIERRNFQDLPRVIGLIDKNLDEGVGVVLFAEGTSTKGERVLPFNPALLEPAARSAYPVSHAAISYRTPPDEVPAEWSVCWWGEMTLLPHFKELLKLPHIDAVICFGSHAIQANDRKVLARGLWQAVNDQFIPVVEPRLPLVCSGSEEIDGINKI